MRDTLPSHINMDSCLEELCKATCMRTWTFVIHFSSLHERLKASSSLYVRPFFGLMPQAVMPTNTSSGTEASDSTLRIASNFRAQAP